jgi:hypothetical protein
LGEEHRPRVELGLAHLRDDAEAARRAYGRIRLRAIIAREEIRQERRHLQSGRASVAKDEDADGRDGLEEGRVADDDDLLVPGSGLGSGLGPVGDADRDGEGDDGGEDWGSASGSIWCEGAAKADVDSVTRTGDESDPSKPADLAERTDTRCARERPKEESVKSDTMR